MSETPRREGPLLPWQKRWDEPRSGVPGQMPDNAVQPKTLLYGPNGEALIVQGPRRVGFREPEGEKR